MLTARFMSSITRATSSIAACRSPYPLPRIQWSHLKCGLQLMKARRCRCGRHAQQRKQRRRRQSCHGHQDLLHRNTKHHGKLLASELG